MATHRNPIDLLVDTYESYLDCKYSSERENVFFARRGSFYEIRVHDGHSFVSTSLTVITNADVNGTVYAVSQALGDTKTGYFEELPHLGTVTLTGNPRSDADAMDLVLFMAVNTFIRVHPNRCFEFNGYLAKRRDRLFARAKAALTSR